MADAAAAKTQIRRNGKSPEAFRTISEVAGELDLPQHVLRFWESKFPQVKPLKRGGGRRYYRPDDLILLKRIRDLLYTDGYTIRGVQKLLRNNGVKKILNDDLINASGNLGDVQEALEAVSAEAGSADSAQRRELAIILLELETIRDTLRKA